MIGKRILLLLFTLAVFVGKGYGQTKSGDLFFDTSKQEEETGFTDPQQELQKRRLIEASLTLLENRNQIIPLLGLDTLKIACLAVGPADTTPFQKMLAKYTQTRNFFLPGQFSTADLEELKVKLKDYNLVIAGIHELNADAKKLLNYLATEKQSVEVFFCNLDVLAERKDFVRPGGLIWAYGNDSLLQELSAQMIFGGIGASGKLAENIGDLYQAGDGIQLNEVIRLKYTIPEEVGMNGARITKRIDSLVYDAISKKATPGCSILAAKDGKVIFSKTYGYHTYDNRIAVQEDDLYDLASVTKVSGATPAVMKLTDEGKIKLDEKFSNNWPDWKRGLFHRSNKQDLRWREILAHQAGLMAYQNYWKETAREGKLKDRWYSFQQSGDYQLEVAPGLFLKQKFKNRIYKDIRLSKLNPERKYVYSGLSFLLIPQITENLIGEPFVGFLDRNFYHPLGAFNITYNPLAKFPESQIVPTEYDSYYRRRLVHGTVHDEAAAMLGGVSGNAGLFANANDLAKLMQMYLQMGTYGGKRYLSESTVREFSRVQFPENKNRRGLGFDKPLLNNAEVSPAKSYPCPGASPQSFGHSGFTGTFVWADPKYQLIYIFLSNRVYPSREDNLLGKLNVRTNILQVLYDELPENQK